MKQVFLTIVLLLSCLSFSFAQLNVKSLLSNSSPEKWRSENTNHYNSLFDHTTIGNIQSSKHQVEIRFFKDFGRENQGALIQIYLNENQNWQAMIHHVERRRNGELHLLSYAEKPVKGWQNLWRLFAQNKLWQLPDDEAIASQKKKVHKRVHISEYPPETQERMRNYLQGEYVVLYESLAITDGNVYEVDIKLGPLFRFFNYANPEDYHDEFPKIKELEYFTNILQDLRSEFKIEF